MKHMDLSYWPARSMSILILIMGMTAVDQSSMLGAINLDPLIYGIVAIGLGFIAVIWFMHEVNISHIP
jgi:hypothetical protein